MPPVGVNVQVIRVPVAFVMLILPWVRVVAPLTVKVVAAVLKANVASVSLTVSAAMVGVVSSDTV
jgi:hypothetical protein